jgi:hypothetical protein
VRSSLQPVHSRAEVISTHTPSMSDACETHAQPNREVYCQCSPLALLIRQHLEITLLSNCNLSLFSLETAYGIGRNCDYSVKLQNAVRRLEKGIHLDFSVTAGSIPTIRPLSFITTHHIPFHPIVREVRSRVATTEESMGARYLVPSFESLRFDSQ